MLNEKMIMTGSKVV